MIGIGNDHGGYNLKLHIKKLLEEKGIEVKDFGSHDTSSVDYPDIALPVCESVVSGECECAILVCGTGIGMSIAANKIKGIRFPIGVLILSDNEPKSGNKNSAKTLSAAIIAPVMVSPTPKLFFKIKGIILSYICQKEQMDMKARPINIVLL